MFVPFIQVVIGGRNKYLINGTNATPSRVQDLFRSVQLNVNNPHFLIMQGRITKVLNMKPPEVSLYVTEFSRNIIYVVPACLEVVVHGSLQISSHILPPPTPPPPTNLPLEKSTRAWY